LKTDFRPEIRRMLTDLEAAQAALRDVLARKRRALQAADVVELERIGALEGECVRELQALLGRRRGILDQAGAGHPAESITDLVERLDDADRPALRRQIARIRAAADEIRRETWVHWIVTRSLSAHYGELLELIANCGREAATYEERPVAHTSAGGAILDASV
jgi:hypothetical protein